MSDCHSKSSVFLLLSWMRVPAKGKEGKNTGRDSEVEVATAYSGRMRVPGIKPTSAFGTCLAEGGKEGRAQAVQ